MHADNFDSYILSTKKGALIYEKLMEKVLELYLCNVSCSMARKVWVVMVLCTDKTTVPLATERI